MTTTAYYMERPASMPMAAPVGAVVTGVEFGRMCASASPFPQHHADFAKAIDGVTERGMTVKDWQLGRTTTNRSTRRLGRPST